MSIGPRPQKESLYEMNYIIGSVKTGDDDYLSKKRCELISDLELIVRSHIEGNQQSSELLRNPTPNTISVHGLCYTKVNAPLHIGDALNEILEYIESHYNIDFDNESEE